MRTPQEHYQHYVDNEKICTDNHQKSAIKALQQVYESLIAPDSRQPTWKNILRIRSGTSVPLVRGVYLWGDVGRGKTFLMDLFYKSLPFENKLRQHFHRFMGGIHKSLKEVQDQQNPLQLVAENLAQKTRIICFDEFFVSDIADAMILGNLFEALFVRGVTLVATSNTKPNELYKNGLQRQQFLKAISLIERNTQVIRLKGSLDYRLRLLERADVYQTPLGKSADQKLAEYFKTITSDEGEKGLKIEILGRTLETRYAAQNAVWFDFKQICDGPRSHNDYIEIARCYQTVLISNIPQLTKESENQTRRLIALVDEFYDRHVKLILSVATDINEIYIGERLISEFQRTQSRLEEMQSHDYLAKPHLP